MTAAAGRRPLRWRDFLPELAIACASILYGATFVLVQDALDHTTPSAFNMLRFALGALVLAPFALRRGWRGPAPRAGDSAGTLVRAGVAIGAVAWAAYLAQNIGLEHTTTSSSAFITGLFAVFTPVLEVLIFRRRPRLATAVAVAIAVVGLLLLTGARPAANVGDAVTLLSAVAFGMWFIQIGLFTTRFDVITLVTVECCVVALLSMPIALAQGWGSLSGDVWLALLFTGIGCSAIAFCLSTWAQRRVEPSRASLLNLLEPVVAGFVGYAVGERLGIGGYAGATLILVAMAVAESGAWRAVAARALPRDRA